jgi:demethylmenaquinone methyltransferase/2-methoxy-6-polyprenyl-1,4-benzoquinol methylase
MFDAIAPRYDLLNRLLSGGIDRWWRKRAIDSLALTGREVLVDVATGTADVALEACAPRRGGARAARVVGVDFARAMLALGVGKVQTAGRVGPHRAGARRRHAAPGGQRVGRCRHHRLRDPERPDRQRGLH